LVGKRQEPNWSMATSWLTSGSPIQPAYPQNVGRKRGKESKRGHSLNPKLRSFYG